MSSQAFSGNGFLCKAPAALAKVTEARRGEVIDIYLGYYCQEIVIILAAMMKHYFYKPNRLQL